MPMPRCSWQSPHRPKHHEVVTRYRTGSREHLNGWFAAQTSYTQFSCSWRRSRSCMAGEAASAWCMPAARWLAACPKMPHKLLRPGNVLFKTTAGFSEAEEWNASKEKLLHRRVFPPLLRELLIPINQHCKSRGIPDENSSYVFQPSDTVMEIKWGGDWKCHELLDRMMSGCNAFSEVLNNQGRYL